MDEQFDGIQKIYQIALPLTHGETFEIEVINKDKDSISFTINRGSKFAVRLPSKMKHLKIGDIASMQYLEYESANKLYARTKLLRLIRD